MRVGIAIVDTWDFFHEIYAELAEKHQTDLFAYKETRSPFFKERINRNLHSRIMRQFIENNDVIFFEWASALLVDATRYPKQCGIVTRIHRYEMYQWVDQVDWDKVDKVVLVSNAKQQEFQTRFPSQAHKTVVIPEAVSLQKFEAISKPFKGDIGILCHLTPRKRVYELILAFYELCRIKDEFHLHIGGDRHVLHGDYYEAMQALVKKLGIEKKVTFYGKVTDTRAWHHKIDIFISNSYSEGLQVSPIEAIASGSYCLSHHWDGADELLPEDALFYTEQQLVEKILQYSALSEDEKYIKREALQDFVRENFDVERIKVQIRQIVEEVGETYQGK